MSGTEQPAVLSGQQYLTGVETTALLNNLGNGEAKIAIAALVQSRPDTAFSAQDLYDDFMALQGRRPVWALETVAHPLRISLSSQLPLGVIEEVRAPSRMDAIASVDGCRAVSRFSQQVLAFCGVAMKWGFEYPNHSAHHMLGRSVGRGGIEPPEVRSDIYRQLLQRGNLTPAKLYRGMRLGDDKYKESSLARQIERLTTLGVLSQDEMGKHIPVTISDAWREPIADFYGLLRELNVRKLFRAHRDYAKEVAGTDGSPVIRALLRKELHFSSAQRGGKTRFDDVPLADRIKTILKTGRGLTARQIRDRLVDVSDGYVYDTEQVLANLGSMINAGSVAATQEPIRKGVMPILHFSLVKPPRRQKLKRDDA